MCSRVRERSMEVCGLEKLCNFATDLSCRCGWRGLRFSRANGFKKSNHVSTQVPFALFQGRVEQEGGMLPTYCWNFHVLQKQPKKNFYTEFLYAVFGKYEQFFPSMVSQPEKECSHAAVGECLTVFSSMFLLSLPSTLCHFYFTHEETEFRNLQPAEKLALPDSKKLRSASCDSLWRM